MTTMIQQGRRRCDARCYGAKGTKCRCICGSRNHGKGREGAVKANQELFHMGDSNEAVFEIVRLELDDNTITIRDIGHTYAKSVTNDAEGVVRRLTLEGLLPAGRRLLYYDSQGMLDEIKVEDGRFAGFAPGPGRRAV